MSAFILDCVPEAGRSPGWRTQSLRPMMGWPLASTDPGEEPGMVWLGVGDVIRGWSGIVGVEVV